MKKINKAAIIFTIIFVASLGFVEQANASVINTLNISIQNPPTPPAKPEPPLPPRIPTPTPRVTPKPTPTSNQGGSSSGGSSPQNCGATKPGTPTILSSIRRGNSQILTWSAATNATYYSIVYGNTPGYQYGVANVGNVTSYTINDLVPGVTYHFSVNAVNDCMPGDPSTPGGRVLGASTMAGTGSFAENLYLALMIIGGIITTVGIKNYKKFFKLAK